MPGFEGPQQADAAEAYQVELPPQEPLFGEKQEENPVLQRKAVCVRTAA